MGIFLNVVNQNQFLKWDVEGEENQCEEIIPF